MPVEDRRRGEREHDARDADRHPRSYTERGVPGSGRLAVRPLVRSARRLTRCCNVTRFDHRPRLLGLEFARSRLPVAHDDVERVIDAQPDQQLTRGDLEPAPGPGDPGHDNADTDEGDQDVDDVSIRDCENAEDEHQRDGRDDREAVADGVRRRLVRNALAEDERVVEPLVDAVRDFDLRVVGRPWLLVRAAVVDLEDERDPRVCLRFARLVVGRKELVGIRVSSLSRAVHGVEPSVSPIAVAGLEHLGEQFLDLFVLDVTFDVETTVESSLSGVVSRLEAGEPVTPRELFTLVMQGDHDPTGHDRVVLAGADGDDLTDEFLERLAAYLGGELRFVTDSRVVIDLEDAADR